MVGDGPNEITAAYADRGGNIVGLHGYALGQVLQTTSDGKPLLANNGGPTWTIVLAHGSSAIGAGIGSICRSSPVDGVDQRGHPRPATGGCDSGAYQH